MEFNRKSQTEIAKEREGDKKKKDIRANGGENRKTDRRAINKKWNINGWRYDFCSILKSPDNLTIDTKLDRFASKPPIIFF